MRQLRRESANLSFHRDITDWRGVLSPEKETHNIHETEEMTWYVRSTRTMIVRRTFEQSDLAARALIGSFCSMLSRQSIWGAGTTRAGSHCYLFSVLDFERQIVEEFKYVKWTFIQVSSYSFILSLHSRPVLPHFAVKSYPGTIHPLFELFRLPIIFQMRGSYMET